MSPFYLNVIDFVYFFKFNDCKNLFIYLFSYLFIVYQSTSYSSEDVDIVRARSIRHKVD